MLNSYYFRATNLYITSLDFEGLTRTQEPQDRILRVLYDGPNGLKWKEIGDRDNNVEYHEIVVRIDEEPRDLEFIIYNRDAKQALCPN